SRVTPGSYPGSLRGGMARAAGGAIRLGSVGERRRHGRAMATETPGPAGGDGGAGPQEAAHRAGGGARLGRTLYAVLWQAPAALEGAIAAGCLAAGDRGGGGGLAAAGRRRPEGARGVGPRAARFPRGGVRGGEPVPVRGDGRRRRGDHRAARPGRAVAVHD